MTRSAKQARYTRSHGESGRAASPRKSTAPTSRAKGVARNGASTRGRSVSREHHVERMREVDGRPRPSSGRSRRPAERRPSSHSVDPFVDRVFTAIKMSFTGEVPASVKGRRMTSEQVNRLVHARLRWTLVVIGLALLVLFGRVVALQTVSRGGYLAESLDQRRRETVVRASRGVIFDRNGHELALSVPRTTIFADPREIPDPAATTRTLAGLLQWSPKTESAFARSIARSGSKFVYVARELTEDQANVILNLGLPGIYSYGEPSRQIEGGVAEAVIGKTDTDGLGISGLELQFNDLLAGKDGQAVREVDSNGRSIAGAATKVAPVPGDDLVLTIDKTIQFRTDEALLDRVGQLGAKGGIAVVMDTQTGNILAMSNVRRTASGSVATSTGNFAAIESYEPGSVAKVFSVGAALNEGTVNADTVMTVPGTRIIDQFKISDAWSHGDVDMDVRTIIRESSNIGTMMIADTIGPEKLHDYLAGFGFGVKTGINYPHESRGTLRPASRWYGSEKSTMSYGYGYSASPLQLVAAVNTVANGGTYVGPRLVDAVINKNGRRTPSAQSVTRRVLSAEAASATTDLLRTVVCSGTGVQAQVRGMQIAGKTGTGYKAQSNGTYLTEDGSRKYFASFAGFFPAAAPRVTVLVSIDEPRAGSRDRFGGTAAAPVFARLVPTIMHELGIPATGTGTGCGATGERAGH